MNMLFHYYVLFPTEASGIDFKPIVTLGSYDASRTVHLWDEELDAIRLALWYILHLPRIGFDVIECGIGLLIHAYDEPHDILSVPYPKKDTPMRKQLLSFVREPTLMRLFELYHDDALSIQDFIDQKTVLADKQKRLREDREAIESDYRAKKQKAERQSAEQEQIIGKTPL